MTQLTVLRVLERVHGHLGWLSVIALLHPAILLRNPRRRARLSVSLAAGLVLTTEIAGVLLYPPYRERLKQQIFLEAPRIGWMFERKEHLAIGVLALSLSGAIAHLSLPLFTGDTRDALARAAHRCFVAALLLSVPVAVLGVVVAVHRTF